MATMTQTPSEQANATLQQMRERLGHKADGMRVWVGDDGRARLYLASRGEYVEWTADGAVSTSQPRVAWGHVLSEIVEGL